MMDKVYLKMDLKLNNLISQIYDAAINPQLWETVCLDASDYFHGTSGVMIMHDHTQSAATVAVHTRFPEDIYQRYMENYYIENDLWYQLITSKCPEKSVSIGSELISDQDLKKTDMYNDILKPTESGRLLAYNTVANKSQAGAFTISRPLSAKEFDYDDKKIMSLLGEHIQRAYLIHRQYFYLMQSNNAANEALNNIAYACLALDNNGHIVFINERAEKTLRENDGIRSLNKKLFFSSTEQQNIFNTYLKKVIATSNNKGTSTGGAIRITRPTGKAAYQLIITPANSNSNTSPNMFYNNASACVFISDPSKTMIIQENILCELYNLTKAEARLTQLLFQGFSPHDISKINHVKISTIRSQLHNIFEKTSTSSQSDLIKFIALGPALMGNPV